MTLFRKLTGILLGVVVGAAIVLIMIIGSFIEGWNNYEPDKTHPVITQESE